MFHNGLYCHSVYIKESVTAVYLHLNISGLLQSPGKTLWGVNIENMLFRAMLLHRMAVCKRRDK